MKFKAVLIVVALCLMLISPTFAAEYAVIVSHKNTVSSLSKGDLKNIFLGKKSSWSNGDKVILYSLYDQQTTGSFTLSIMNKSAQQFSTFWKKALFTGTGRPPLEMKTPSEMKKFIAADPRGIGYIPAGDVDSSVKVISIQ